MSIKTPDTNLTFTSVEMWALRLILIEYARNKDNPQTFEDVLTENSVTLSDLMLKLMPKIN
jgi:hypothetical protein